MLEAGEMWTKTRFFSLALSVASMKRSCQVTHLTRHRLGCFCTHHSLWGVGSDPPPLLSRKRMDLERRTRRHSKDLDETLPNHFRKFKIEVTCQVKVRSKVKIGCFQVADRSDLKRSMFRPKLSICTPKDQARVLTSEIVSYLAQVKVKVRSEKVTKSKILNVSFDTCFMVHFGQRTRYSRLFYILTSFEQKNIENRFKVR